MKPTLLSMFLFFVAYLAIQVAIIVLIQEVTK